MLSSIFMNPKLYLNFLDSASKYFELECQNVKDNSYQVLILFNNTLYLH